MDKKRFNAQLKKAQQLASEGLLCFDGDWIDWLCYDEDENALHALTDKSERRWYKARETLPLMLIAHEVLT